MLKPSARPSLVKSSLFNISGALLPLIVQLVTVPIYLKLIGMDRYGVLSIVWLILGYFGLFDLGFGQALASRMATMHDHSHEARSQLFWTGTLMSAATGAFGGILLYAFGFTLFTHVFQIPPELQDEAVAALPLIAFCLPLATAISAMSGALQGRQAFLTMNLAQMMGMISYQILPLIICIFVPVSLSWLIGMAIVGRLITLIMLLLFCVPAVPISLKPRLSRAEIKPMLRYGGWVTVTGIIGPILTIFDRFVLGATIGMKAVAIYSVPYNIIMRVTVLPGSIQSALFPRFAMDNEKDSRELMLRSIRFQAWLMPLIILTGMLLIEPFLNVWIGADIAPAAGSIAHILFIGLWLNILAYVPYCFLQSRGRPDLPAKFHLLELPFYVPALWFLIKFMGLDGAAIAWDLRVGIDMLLLFAAAKVSKNKAVLWGTIWIVLGFSWASFIKDNPVLYASGTVILLLGCAVWGWITMPSEIKNTVLSWRRQHKASKI